LSPLEALFTLFTMTELREKILSSACELYLDDGLQGFSMRKLARSVGVTAPALYRHFDGKEELLLEVVGEAYKVFLQYLNRGLRGGDAEERFRLAGDGYLDFALDHQRLYEMLYSYKQYLGLREVPPEVAPLACAIHQFWVDRVRECMEAGVLAPGEPEAVSRTFWGLTHGLISIHHRQMMGPLSQDAFREIFRTSMRSLMSGVGNPARMPFEGATAIAASSDPSLDRGGTPRHEPRI